MKKTGIIILIIVLICIVISLGNVLIYAINHRGGNMNIFQSFGGNIRTEEYKKEEKVIEIDKIEQLDMKFISSDVHIILTEEPNLKIVEYSSENEETLKIEKEGRDVKIQEKGRIGFLIFYYKQTAYDIYLPKSYQKNIDIATTSGNIQVDGEIQLENLVVNSTSADIRWENTIKVENIEIATVSGQITLGKVESEKIEVKTTSGDIKIQKAQNEMIAKSVSGTIKIEEMNGSIEAKTTSGDITIEQAQVEEDCTIKSTSGNVKMEIMPTSNCKIKTKSTSGKITLPNGENTIGEGPYHSLEVKTTSGNIRLTIK